MAVKDLLIKIGVKGADKAEKQLSKSESAMKGLGKAALKVGGAFFAAQGVIAGFKTVVQAAARQEQAEKALQVALGRTSKALLDQASSLQSVTTAGDEAIIEQQAFLASLKFTEDQIKDIIPVALDLSAATGISLESAVRNTSKTFSGLAGELGELVPQLRDLTKEEMEAGKAVEVLGNLFEGQASKQAETMSGSLDQMNNSIGDAAESIGSLLAPMVIKTAKGIKSLAEGVSSVTRRFKNFGKEVDAVILDPEQLAIQSLEEFRKEVQGMSEDDLKDLVEKLNRANSGMKHWSEASDIHNEKMIILEETLTALKDAQDKINQSAIDALGIRKSESSDLSFIDEKYKLFIETKQAELLATEEQEKMNARLIDQYPILAEKLGLVKSGADENNQAWSDFKNSLNEATAASVQQGAAITNTANALKGAEDAAKSVAVNFVSAEITKAVAGYIRRFLLETPLPPFVSAPLALAGGAAFGSLMGSAIQRAEFAEGGIVPGIGNTDSVPAMLTPGEVILNKAQQENLVGGMGVTVNIQGNMIGNESFVRDTLIPEIAKAQNQGLA